MVHRIPGIERPRLYDSVEDGCEISSTCLECPLPLCIEDIPIGIQIMLARAARVKSYRDSGFTYKEIAVELSISVDTVKNLLTNSRDNSFEQVMETYLLNEYLQGRAF